MDKKYFNNTNNNKKKTRSNYQNLKNVSSSKKEKFSSKTKSVSTKVSYGYLITFNTNPFNLI